MFHILGFLLYDRKPAYTSNVTNLEICFDKNNLALEDRLLDVCAPRLECLDLDLTRRCSSSRASRVGSKPSSAESDTLGVTPAPR